MEFKSIDDMARRIMGSLPAGFETMRQDIEKNVQAAIRSGLARMDLVTREEFEVQQAVLERTRAKLTALEAQMHELEERLAAAPAQAAGQKKSPNKKNKEQGET